jgi:hypothetical protein
METATTRADYVFLEMGENLARATASAAIDRFHEPSPPHRRMRVSLIASFSGDAKLAQMPARVCKFSTERPLS